jgi:hypothetical protein
MTEISRSEFDALVSRVDRQEPVAVLAVQVAEVIKDVTQLAGDLKDHRLEHAEDQRSRSSARRWAIGLAVVLFAAVESPLVTLLLTRH